MRQIEYNNAAFTMRLEFPSSWDVMDVAAVTMRITDLAGTEMLAATASTLWSTSTIQLNGAVSAFDRTVVLEVNGGGVVDALTTGDRLRIGSSGSGPYEEVKVIAWDSVTNTATLDRDLRFAHSDEAVVVGLFALYDLDVSDLDVFPLGQQMVLHWSPDTDDLEITERAEIARAEFAFPGFESSFATLHSYEYEAATSPPHRLDGFLREALLQTRMDLRMRSLDVNRVVDQELLLPTVTAKVRWLILMAGDDRYDATAQLEIARDEWSRQFETLCGLPIWVDDDQDEIKDEGEVATHDYYMQYRGI